MADTPANGKPGAPGSSPAERTPGVPKPATTGMASGPVAAVNVLARPVEAEMRKSFLDYAMSVIVARALPDARDGLKPVHRRILYGMTELGMGPTSSYKKSARVVGDVLGKYHPHGDSAVYEAMVRMAQEWSLRYVLVDGQGNFGSVDGDSAAAMRYTESRLARFSQHLLADLDKETVDFVPNFDGSLQEPAVLPSAVPNLLVNGSAGIAVGMATNVPPHNLTEIVDAAIRLIDEPAATSMDLMAHVQGPDFPTGGIIYGKGGIISYLSTGRGRVVVRGAHTVEKMDKDRERIVFHEIPYQVNKSDLLISMADLVKDKVLEGISDLRDESDRRGMRLVIELKRDAIPDVVLNQLWKHTALQSSFAVNNLALVDGRPRTMGLRELLLVFLKHRFEVVTRRTQFELRKAEARAHILEGLLKALANIDAVVALIRASRDPEVALAGLMAQFGLTDIQGKAILDMRLQRLTGLETDAVKAEHQQLQVQIAYYKGVLADPAQVYGIIKEELGKARAESGDKRRTQIVEGDVDIDDESLIPEEESVFMLTQEQYVKRMPVATWKEQGRGGKGLRSMALKGGAEDESKAAGDEIVNVTVGSTHDYLCFFTNKGRLYWLKGYKVPTGSRQAKGKPLVNLLNLEGDERVETVIPIRDFDEGTKGPDGAELPEDAPRPTLFFATKKGLVKRTVLSAYGNVRSVGIQAINLEEGDSLLAVVKTDGKKEIVLGTKLGQAIRFDESDVRPMGRTAYGVWGADLETGDEVVSLGVAWPGCELLSITEKGYGKRTPLEEYRKTARGAKGVKSIVVNERNGNVVCVRPVKGDESLLVLTSGGIAIRMRIGGEGGISTIGRATQGVRVVRLDEGDSVAQVAILPAQEDEGDGIVLPPELSGAGGGAPAAAGAGAAAGSPAGTPEPGPDQGRGQPPPGPAGQA